MQQNFGNICRAFYYQQESVTASRVPRPHAKPANLVMNIAYSRASCSDTDSGICVDSCSEHSNPSPKFAPVLPDWRAMPKLPTTTEHCNHSNLKIRKQLDVRQKKSNKPLKVRFTEPGPANNDRPSPPPLPPPPAQSTYYYISQDNKNPEKSLLKFPYPPPYEVAVDRIHQMNNQQDKQRSMSLSRDFRRHATVPKFEACVQAKSMEQINFSTFPRNCSMNKQTSGVVSHAGVMLAGSRDHIEHMDDPIDSRSRSRAKFSLTGALHNLASNVLQKMDSQERLAEDMPTVFERHSGVCDPLPNNVQATLMGIDNRGIHVIELKKCEEGPFGFYISTGTYKKKKGIYISRVTERNLHTLLKVGDQLIQIDDLGVKGKTLEQIRAMMMNKEKVVLKILPLL